MAYASRRQFALAIADLTRATELAPKEGRYLTERARVYWENGEPGRAKPDLDKALQLDPGDTLALVTRADLRIGYGDKPGALADLGAADRALPKEADIRLEMAELYDRADAGAAAVGQLSLWIKAHPDDNRLAGALNERCWDRALLDIDADKALADCDAALRRSRKNAAFYDSRGLAHLRLGQNDLAIADYDAALAIEPKLPWSLYGRGLAKLRKAQTAAGKADLAAATTLAPKLPDYAKAHGFTP
jgi:tetratricopeptide (TPR) repeat protein